MKATLQKQEAQPASTGRSRNGQYLAPDVNIYETKDGYLLEAEMPGVNKEGLEITLEGNQLTIAGHRPHNSVSGQLLFRESQNVDYRRVFELDPAIDTGNVSAKMEQG